MFGQITHTKDIILCTEFTTFVEIRFGKAKSVAVDFFYSGWVGERKLVWGDTDDWAVGLVRFVD
jgi:hypothetical protein